MLKKILNLTLLLMLLLAELYFVAAPAVMDAATSDTDTIVASLSVTDELTMSAEGDITLLPTIPGITGSGGILSSASATWTVITNNSTGFNLTIFASQDNALFLGTPSDQYFTDYTPASAGTPDYAWGQPASGQAEFGYSVAAGTAADATTAFKNNTSNACGTGSANSTANCFLDLVVSPGTTIVNRSTYTGAGGVTETVKFWAESNAKFLKEGTYSATITVTATTN